MRPLEEITPTLAVSALAMALALLALRSGLL